MVLFGRICSNVFFQVLLFRGAAYGGRGVSKGKVTNHWFPLTTLTLPTLASNKPCFGKPSFCTTLTQPLDNPQTTLR